MLRVLGRAVASRVCRRGFRSTRALLSEAANASEEKVVSGPAGQSWYVWGATDLKYSGVSSKDDWVKAGSFYWRKPQLLVSPDGKEPIVDVSMSSSHVLLLLRDGRVFAYGLNEANEVTGAASQQSVVSSEQAVQVPLDAKITSISAGEKVSVATAADGTVYQWGGYKDGVTTVTGDDFWDVALDESTSIGEWDQDEAKFDTENGVPAPVLQKAVAGGGGNVGFLLDPSVSPIWAKNNIFTVGPNLYGSAGQPSSVSFDSPTSPRFVYREKDLATCVDVAIAGDHGLAVNADGATYSWGLNDEGQCSPDRGAPDFFEAPHIGLWDSSEPGLVDRVNWGDETDRQFESVRAGLGISAAQTSTGEVHVWGVGSTHAKAAPITGVSDYGAGNGFVALLDQDGKVHVTGRGTWRFNMQRYGVENVAQQQEDGEQQEEEDAEEEQQQEGSDGQAQQSDLSAGLDEEPAVFTEGGLSTGDSYAAANLRDLGHGQTINFQTYTLATDDVALRTGAGDIFADENADLEQYSEVTWFGDGKVGGSDQERLGRVQSLRVGGEGLAALVK